MVAVVRLWAAMALLAAVMPGCFGPATPEDAVQTVTPTAAPTMTVTPTLTASPTLTPTATPSPTPTVTPSPTPTEEVRMARFTIVYDNNQHDPALRTGWGFSCLVETEAGTVLFDTGGDSPTLLGNFERLGLDTAAVEAVVLSHIHGDHTGGLMGLLDTGVRPTVYVPAAFPESFKAQVRARTPLVEVDGPLEVLPGIYATGAVGSGGIVEQGLVVETDAGAVVLTGCAHPGVVEIVRRAKEVVPGDVALVMGGFHLRDFGRERIAGIIAALQDLGVRGAAPCHCSGDLARQMFAESFGTGFIRAGVGTVLSVEGGEVRVCE